MEVGVGEGNGEGVEVGLGDKVGVGEAVGVGVGFGEGVAVGWAHPRMPTLMTERVTSNGRMALMLVRITEPSLASPECMEDTRSSTNSVLSQS